MMGIASGHSYTKGLWETGDANFCEGAMSSNRITLKLKEKINGGCP